MQFALGVRLHVRRFSHKLLNFCNCDSGCSHSVGHCVQARIDGVIGTACGKNALLAKHKRHDERGKPEDPNCNENAAQVHDTRQGVGLTRLLVFVHTRVSIVVRHETMASSDCSGTSGEADLAHLLALVQSTQEVAAAAIASAGGGSVCSCPAAGSCCSAPGPAIPASLVDQSFASLGLGSRFRNSKKEYLDILHGASDLLNAGTVVPHAALQHINAIYRIEGLPLILKPTDGFVKFATPKPVDEVATCLGAVYHSSTQQTIDEVVGGDGNSLRLNRLRFDRPETTLFVVC